MSTIKIERKDGYAIVELNNGKVNAITTELSRDVAQAFTDLAQDDSVNGVILAGRPHGFSAGLDVVSLATGTPEQSNEFWRQYYEALRAMVRYPKPFVCAITGYAPAGATIWTMCADYRVMGQGEKHVLGMHEFKMSMLVPHQLCKIYAYHLGERQAWLAIQQMRLFNSDESLARGIVEESVPVEEVMERSVKHLKKLMRVLSPVFIENKKYLRKGLLDIVSISPDELINEFNQFAASAPEMKKMTEMFLASLKKG